MRIQEFTYEVHCEVEMTGRDLSVLRVCALTHYDAATRGIFVPGPGAFGNGWLCEWQSVAQDRDEDGGLVDEWKDLAFEDAPDTAVIVRVKTRQADACMKALENIGGLDAEQKALSDVLYRTFKDVIDQACTERERLERLQEDRP